MTGLARRAPTVIGLGLLLAAPLAATCAGEGPAPSSGAAKDPATALFEAGEASFRRGQEATQGRLPGVEAAPYLRQAIRLFADLERRFPRGERTPQGIFLSGSSHLFLDEPEQALAAYRRAFEANAAWPERSKALLRAGNCQAALGDAAQARATFNRLILEFPGRKEDVERARRHLLEVGIMGQRAPAVQATRWLHGTSAAEGLGTFQGEVVVLVFFATWCTSCQRELPHIRSLMTRLGSHGVIFLGVANPEDPQSTEGVDSYIQRNALSFLDVALDTKQSSWVPYRVGGFPAAALIDRRGIIRWRGHPGLLTSTLVERVLGER